MTKESWMKVESIAECSSWSILQYFWPELIDNRSWKPVLVFFLSGRLRQVLLYANNKDAYQPVHLKKKKLFDSCLNSIYIEYLSK